MFVVGDSVLLEIWSVWRWVFGLGGVLLTSSGWRPGVLLYILQYTGQPPQQRIIRLKISTVPKLRQSWGQRLLEFLKNASAPCKLIYSVERRGITQAENSPHWSLVPHWHDFVVHSLAFCHLHAVVTWLNYLSPVKQKQLEGRTHGACSFVSFTEHLIK